MNNSLLSLILGAIFVFVLTICNIYRLHLSLQISLSLLLTLYVFLILQCLESCKQEAESTRDHGYIESFTEAETKFQSETDKKTSCEAINLLNRDNIGDFRNGAFLPNTVLPVAESFQVIQLQNPGTSEYCLMETGTVDNVDDVSAFYCLEWNMFPRKRCINDGKSPRNDNLNDYEYLQDSTPIFRDLSVHRTYVFELWHGSVISDDVAADVSRDCLTPTDSHIRFQFRVYRGAKRGDYSFTSRDYIDKDVWEAFETRVESTCDRIIQSSVTTDRVRWRKLTSVFTVPPDATKLIWALSSRDPADAKVVGRGSVGVGGRGDVHYWTGFSLSRHLTALPDFKVTAGITCMLTRALRVELKTWFDISGYDNHLHLLSSRFQKNEKNGVFCQENAVAHGPQTSKSVTNSFTVSFMVSYKKVDVLSSSNEAEETHPVPVLFVLRGEIYAGENSIQTDFLQINSSQHSVHIQQGENVHDLNFRTFDISPVMYSIVVNESGHIELWRDGDLVLKKDHWFNAKFQPSNRPSEWHFCNWRFMHAISVHAYALCSSQITELHRYVAQHINQIGGLAKPRETLYIVRKTKCPAQEECALRLGSLVAKAAASPHVSPIIEAKKIVAAAPKAFDDDESNRYFRMSELRRNQYEDMDVAARMRTLDDTPRVAEI